MYTERCVNILVALVSQLQQRLPSNIDVLQKVSLLSPDNCLRVRKQSIVPLAEHMMQSRDNISKIELQWNKLTLIEWSSSVIDNTVSFWSEAACYRDASGDNPFRELSDFALSLLVLPWSNAEVERAFSQLNLVKTDLRNRMGYDMLNAILTVRAGLRRLGKCCHDYQLPDGDLKKKKELWQHTARHLPVHLSVAMGKKRISMRRRMGFHSHSKVCL